MAGMAVAPAAKARMVVKSILMGWLWFLGLARGFVAEREVRNWRMLMMMLL
jgi:hypothetical protein